MLEILIHVSFGVHSIRFNILNVVIYREQKSIRDKPCDKTQQNNQLYNRSCRLYKMHDLVRGLENDMSKKTVYKLFGTMVALLT